MDELSLNEIVITPSVDRPTSLSFVSPLFNIESSNTAEAKIQSVCTDNRNEHTVQKLSPESTIAAKVPNGQLLLVSSTSSIIKNRALAAILLKQ